MVGVLGAAVIGAIVGWDWWQTRDFPTEHTTVVSIHETGGWDRCGRRIYEHEVVVTRRSSDPPSGLPPTFDHVEGCGAPSVGEHEVVVRVPRSDGSLDVYVDPPRSAADVGAVGLAAFGLTAVCGVVVFGVLETWRNRRAGRRRRT